MAEDIFVNEIHEDKYGIHGIVIKSDQVAICLRTIFGYKIANVLRDQAKSVAEFYLIERFYQFAVFIHFHKKTGFYIKLSDFSKSSGAALDEYLASEAKDWQKMDRDKYASIVQGIWRDKSETVKIIAAC